MRMSRSLALMLAAAVLVPMRGASAANGNKPRVPVIWSAGACATIVDQQAAPIIHFEYSVASEEDPADRTEDEVDDSRTHQFIAFAKDEYRTDRPVWITRADIQRAALVDGEVDEASIDANEILEETNRFFADEWVRITPDDARVPITFEQAAMGVDWDTTGVAPGTYQIWGYTWEPVLNDWVSRPGFVKLIANSSAAADAGPSIAILRDETQIIAGTPYPIPGCADVGEGTTVTLEWGESIGSIEPEWQPSLEDEPIATGDLGITFVPPDAAGGKSIRLRATVTDAEGRSYITYSPTVLAVAENPNPSDTSGDASGADGDEEGGGEGCECSAAHGAAPWWLIVLPVLRIRRRRRDTAA